MEDLTVFSNRSTTHGLNLPKMLDLPKQTEETSACLRQRTGEAFAKARYSEWLAQTLPKL